MRALAAASASFLLLGCPGTIQDPDRFRECRLSLDVPTDVLAARCGTALCHDGKEPESNLDLVSPGVELRLVGIPSTTCFGRKRIDPEHPDRSFLLEKLQQDTPACGARMPLLAETLDEPTLFCVREWIDHAVALAEADPDAAARPDGAGAP